MSMTGIQIAQTIISASAGLFGVGVGVGMFRGTIKQIHSTIKQIQKDMEIVQYKQRRLRGEDNGSIPLYITRNGCFTLREGCEKKYNELLKSVNTDLQEHKKAIKSLENFARWSMQREGLKIEEINKILNV